MTQWNQEYMQQFIKTHLEFGWDPNFVSQTVSSFTPNPDRRLFCETDSDILEQVAPAVDLTDQRLLFTPFSIVIF